MSIKQHIQGNNTDKEGNSNKFGRWRDEEKQIKREQGKKYVSIYFVHLRSVPQNVKKNSLRIKQDGKIEKDGLIRKL